MSFKNADIALLHDKKLFIFDMDGTIYLGGKPFDFAIEFIKNLRAAGKKVLFFTNNASRTSDTYVKMLCDMGFEATPDEVVTAGDVTVDYLINFRAGKKVFFVTTDELVRECRARGVNVIGENEDSADVVVVSMDTDVTFSKISNGCRYIANGAEFFATHPDAKCPVENGFIPDAGAFVSFVTTVTDKEPTYFGKPGAKAVDKVRRMTGIEIEDMCVCGDRLYTDIALGKKAGMLAIAVFTGEAQMPDVEAAEGDNRPDYAFPSIDELDRAMFGEA